MSNIFVLLHKSPQWRDTDQIIDAKARKNLLQRNIPDRKNESFPAMQPAEIVYLNGEFVKKDEACLSPFDRGFLFSHAAYEVTAVFNGKLIDFDAHMARLDRTLDGIDIPRDGLAERLKSLHQELIDKNRRNGLSFSVTLA